MADVGDYGERVEAPEKKKWITLFPLGVSVCHSGA